MTNYYSTLEPNTLYHIFNRGNNRENLFYKAANYLYFLEKYGKYLFPVLETYAYVLLPNHFHLMVRVRGREEMQSLTRERGNLDFPSLKDLESLNPHQIVSELFRRFFMAYAKAINKQEGRTGSLFQKNFKRLVVDSNVYSSNLIRYIHANPQLHGIWDDYKEWPYSSFASLLSDGTSKLQRTDVLGWFGGKDEMMAAHSQYMDFKAIGHLIIED
jgi:putative transposase